MRFTSFTLATILLTSLNPSYAQEFPVSGDNVWMAPTEEDVRSPCPFINVLANHGIINRSGKDVDLFEMAQLLSSTFDVAPPLFNFLASDAVNRGFTTTDENGIVRMDIDALFAHNEQEHDASFVRTDHDFGFEESKLPNDALLKNLFNTNPGSDVLTKEDIMKVQTGRILDSRANNPNVSIVEEQAVPFSAQSTLFLAFGKDPQLISVKKSDLEEILRNERLPTGYVPVATVDENFVPFDVIAEGTLANDIRLEFVESFNAARTADLDEATMTNGEHDTSASSNLLVVAITAVLVPGLALLM